MNNIEKLEHIIYLVNRYEDKVDISKSILNEKQWQSSLIQEDVSVEQVEKTFDEHSQNIENLAKVYIERIKSILKEKK